MLKLKTLTLVLILFTSIHGFTRKRAVPPQVTNLKFKIDLLIRNLKHPSFCSQKRALQELIALSSLQKNKKTMIAYKVIPALLLLLTQKPTIKKRVALTSYLLSTLIREYRKNYLNSK